MKLTPPTQDGHFRPEKAAPSELEEYRKELERGPRKGLLTRFRLWLARDRKQKFPR